MHAAPRSHLTKPWRLRRYATSLPRSMYSTCKKTVDSLVPIGRGHPTAGTCKVSDPAQSKQHRPRPRPTAHAESSYCSASQQVLPGECRQHELLQLHPPAGCRRYAGRCQAVVPSSPALPL